MFKGTYAALWTPFDESDEVCESLLREHVEFLIGKGIDGLYVCGNSGQGLLLSVEERMKVLETVKDQSAGRAKVVAQVAALATRDVKRLVAHANELGADAISSMPPVYMPYSNAEAVEYYHAINADSKLPCFIYHIAALAQNISNDTMMKLADIPQIVGLKYTGSAFHVLQDLLQRTKGKWIAFSGTDQLALGGLAMGTVGSIGNHQNAFPELFGAVYDKFHAGDWSGAMDAQALITRIAAIRDKYGGGTTSYGKAAATHALLKLRGGDPGLCRPPSTRRLPAEKEQAMLDEVRLAVDASDYPHLLSLQ
ncbi:MAG: dihydrodipicolinate synthase family protein [Planctomycetes bacterium]|nr:dihydrodipicolinate synthase family protein [Planctomycetota bacterium]